MYIFSPKEINKVAEDVAYEEAEFGMEIDGGIVDEGDMKGDDHTTAGPIQTVTRISNDLECEGFSMSTMCLVDLNHLKKLTSLNINKC
ncbi:hypothetical protein DPMN_050935 [Dreissena polymorpha]|uniref:Uncharacterized protein n=1 Tax=Dreissena polymorpha TaxID=45954 RepID=A0A9D4CIU3_DREPO|nr:hypothetical protein DPMN_050935 [Dreissena polymorpha]